MAVALLIFISGCVTQPPVTEKGLLLKMDANPREVFGEGITTISVDVENQDTKTLKGVNVDIFEIGSLDFVDTNKCKKDFGNLDVKDFKTFACNLKAKKVERAIDNTVWARAEYKSTLSAAQVFDIISPAELETRKKTGKSVEAQKTFSFKDNNLELIMELSNAPLVDKAGREFVSFKIKNIGNGFIEKLSTRDIKIGSSEKNPTTQKDIIECLSNDIYIIGREFPRFSCAINLRGDISFLPVRLKIDINYNYEIRNSVDVRILKGGVAEAPAVTPAPRATPTPAPTLRDCTVPITWPAWRDGTVIEIRKVSGPSAIAAAPVNDPNNPRTSLNYEKRLPGTYVLNIYGWKDEQSYNSYVRSADLQQRENLVTESRTTIAENVRVDAVCPTKTPVSV